MKKFLLLSVLAAFLPSLAVPAQEKAAGIQFKPYGFVRNYCVFDSRQASSGTQDLYFFCPKDVKLGEDGQDLNALPSLKMVALSSRLGLDVTGFHYGGMDVSAKIEADFYSMNGSTAVFRLRQAFIDMQWENLWNREQSALSVTAGQKWHPMAIDMPHVIALETGAPFGPFSRTPQLTATLEVNRNFSLTGSLLYQMQYLSIGPRAKKQDYIKYSCIPEIYLGAGFRNGGFSGKIGVDILNIKPRSVEGTGKGRKVSDRLMTVSPFAFVKYSKGDFSINAKTILAEAGEHMNLLSGYGVSGINDDLSWEYTPMRSTASFISAKYGRKLQFLGMLGYMKLLGTRDPLHGEDGFTSPDYYYFNTAATSNINQMVRFTPTVAYNWSKLMLALEYNLSSAEYGTYDEFNHVPSSDGLVRKDLHWVTSHRLVMMLKYSF